MSLIVFVLFLWLLPLRQTVPAQLEGVGKVMGLGSQPAVRLLSPTPEPSPTAVNASSAPVPASAAPTALRSAPTPTAATSAAAHVKPVAEPPPPPLTPTPKAQMYTVQPGDTLYSIARRQGTSPQVLAAMNGLAGDTLIKVGQTLRIP